MWIGQEVRSKLSFCALQTNKNVDLPRNGLEVRSRVTFSALQINKNGCEMDKGWSRGLGLAFCSKQTEMWIGQEMDDRVVFSYFKSYKLQYVDWRNFK